MKTHIPCLIVPVLALAGQSVRADEPVQFSRDVLPVLSATCFACHGPDAQERQGDLRLDLEAEAKAVRHGAAAVWPENPDQSLILQRITSTDPDEVMPPPSSRKEITNEQRDTIRRWISEGAKWEQHWSFNPIIEPEGSIDDLVRAQLKIKGQALRPPAKPESLVRRLSLDLIGLPPGPDMATAFAQNPSQAAYERLVDELLDSPRFGEHWARMWLDLARYADTKGYEKDLGRTMWPYRDWVIQALNADMPLDQFTIEQLAGDLLPNPTEPQIIATAFHRNTMCNDEGGTDDEEFRVAAVKDRVDTTVQVWMGLTMGCAKCHTHKYDPISNDDYYRFYAIFNQTEDADRYDDAPRKELLSPAQLAQRAELQTQVSKLSDELKALEQGSAPESPEEAAAWKAHEVVEARSEKAATLTVMPDRSIAASGVAEAEDTYTVVATLPAGVHSALRLEAIPARLPNGSYGVGRSEADPNFVVSDLTVETIAGEGPVATPAKLGAARATFAQEGWPVAGAIDGDPKTGWAVSPRKSERHAAIFAFEPALTVNVPTSFRVSIRQLYGKGLTLAQFRVSTATGDPTTLPLPQPSPEVRRLREELAAAQKTLNTFNSELVQLPILRELPANQQRVTKIQKRGNFLDPGDAVSPAFLSAFGTFPAGVAPDRLAVARMLVSQENPLTPRVWANRIWARLFGAGIVETEEDFGALGSLPSNPRLLERLAADYRNQGWSLKKLIKFIVMSETYRQGSEISPELREADPRNVLQSRGARYRLSAEVVRDQALAVSGLLSSKMYGPSVMPPQPAGLWRSTYNGKSWVDAEGEDRFRRSLYTYLKRTTPYPAFMTFDASSGEVCQIRRIRTNTPLQALVTLNDPVFLEAAAALARRMMKEADTPQARVEYGLRLALVRPVHEGEALPLLRLQAEALRDFEAAPERAAGFVKAGRGEVGDQKLTEFAAWMVTASAILNLDEFLTRN